MSAETTCTKVGWGEQKVVESNKHDQEDDEVAQRHATGKSSSSPQSFGSSFAWSSRGAKMALWLALDCNLTMIGSFLCLALVASIRYFLLVSRPLCQHYLQSYCYDDVLLTYQTNSSLAGREASEQQQQGQGPLIGSADEIFADFLSQRPSILNFSHHYYYADGPRYLYAVIFAGPLGMLLAPYLALEASGWRWKEIFGSVRQLMAVILLGCAAMPLSFVLERTLESYRFSFVTYSTFAIHGCIVYFFYSRYALSSSSSPSPPPVSPSTTSRSSIEAEGSRGMGHFLSFLASFLSLPCSGSRRHSVVRQQQLDLSRRRSSIRKPWEAQKEPIETSAGQTTPSNTLVRTSTGSVLIKACGLHALMLLLSFGLLIVARFFSQKVVFSFQDTWKDRIALSLAVGIVVLLSQTAVDWARNVFRSLGLYYSTGRRREERRRKLPLCLLVQGKAAAVGVVGEERRQDGGEKREFKREEEESSRAGNAEEANKNLGTWTQPPFGNRKDKDKEMTKRKTDNLEERWEAMDGGRGNGPPLLEPPLSLASPRSLSSSTASSFYDEAPLLRAPPARGDNSQMQQQPSLPSLSKKISVSPRPDASSQSPRYESRTKEGKTSLTVEARSTVGEKNELEGRRKEDGQRGGENAEKELARNAAATAAGKRETAKKGGGVRGEEYFPLASIFLSSCLVCQMALRLGDPADFFSALGSTGIISVPLMLIAHYWAIRKPLRFVASRRRKKKASLSSISSLIPTPRRVAPPSSSTASPRIPSLSLHQSEGGHQKKRASGEQQNEKWETERRENDDEEEAAKAYIIYEKLVFADLALATLYLNFVLAGAVVALPSHAEFLYLKLFFGGQCAQAERESLWRTPVTSKASLSLYVFLAAANTALLLLFLAILELAKVRVLKRWRELRWRLLRTVLLGWLLTLSFSYPTMQCHFLMKAARYTLKQYFDSCQDHWTPLVMEGETIRLPT